jgi:hypothetical protein
MQVNILINVYENNSTERIACTKFSSRKWGGIQWQIPPKNLNS